jgi:hypothetical protein
MLASRFDVRLDFHWWAPFVSFLLGLLLASESGSALLN